MLFLLFGALCISFAPILVKLLPFPSEVISFYRCGFAALFMMAVLLSQKKFPFTFNFSLIKFGIYTSLAFTADLYVWHISIKEIGAGLATILANTQVFYLSIWGLLFFKEKLNKNQILIILFSFFGVALLCYSPTEIQNNTNFVTGCILALLAGLFYSLFTLNLKQFAFHSKKKLNDSQRLLVVCLFTSLFNTPFLFVSPESFIISNTTHLITFCILGLLVQYIGWYFIKRGILQVSTSTTGLILLLQPVMACIWSYLLFSENFSSTQIFGGCISLIGIYLFQHPKVVSN